PDLPGALARPRRRGRAERGPPAARRARVPAARGGRGSRPGAGAVPCCRRKAPPGDVCHRRAAPRTRGGRALMFVSTVWVLSFGALWLLVALVAVAQALVIRHALRLEQQLLDATDGPELGAEVPPVRLADLAGEVRMLLPGGGRKLAIFFISPSCPACAQV